MRLLQFVRDWTLILAIVAGVAAYFAVDALPLSHAARAGLLDAIGIVQPVLIFAMLFLSLLRVEPRDIRPRRWHARLLLIQAGLFGALALVLVMLPGCPMRIALEGAMVCLICPTATAAAVVTRKLGGDMGGITTYTILINLVAALLIPLLVPLVHAAPGVSPLSASLLIGGKVFPLLLLPLVLAFAVNRLWPGVRRALDRAPDLPFYLWAFSLALAVAVTVRSIDVSGVPLATQLWLVAVSLACCIFQFAAGRRIGAPFGETVTAGQALGQKNTVFAIWLAYTFFSPVTAVAGGFYCLWHNLVNSRQLYTHNHRKPVARPSS